jgi:hypothetical protein
MTDKYRSRKIPEWANTAGTNAAILNPGPFVGIVKNNYDNTRSGRLQVWIPDLGGDENNPSYWTTVSYVSPFMGVTYEPQTSKNNSYNYVQHAYGMWFAAPDIGNQVLCIFVNGAADRGYWFGVTNPNLSHYMMPAIGSSPNVDSSGISKELKDSLIEGQVYPVAEFNENDPALQVPDFADNKKPIHEAQFATLLTQGLDRDPVRGAISSSSQRESPSRVFGISTPGRPIKDPTTDPQYAKKVQDGSVTESDIAVRGRRGGHTIVMDDGDINNVDNLIRLRTAGGHQLLMNDTEGVMYIANSAGSVWLELAKNGSVHLFSHGGINIRSKGDLNLHSDKNINMHAKGKLQMFSDGSIGLESKTINVKSTDATTLYGGTVNVGSEGAINLASSGSGSWQAGGSLNLTGKPINLNSAGGPSVEAPAGMHLYDHTEASFNKTSKTWHQDGASVSSISAILPTHEPWDRLTGKPKSTPAQQYAAPVQANKAVNEGEAPVETSQAPDCIPTTSPVTTGTGGTTNLVTQNQLDPGIQAAKGRPVSKPCPKNWLDLGVAPNPSGGIGPLDQFAVKCLMGQIGYTESGWKYDIKNQLNYIGRYQFGAAACTDAGYIKLNYFKQYGNRAFNYPDAWTAKDGICSIDNWYSARAVQEKAMYNLIASNYKTLVKIGGIKSSDSICEVGGMLAVAQLLGAGGAKTWRNTGGGADANGTTGETYFNRGKYAIDVLAKGGGNDAPPPKI